MTGYSEPNFSNARLPPFSFGTKTVVGVLNPASANINDVLYLSEQISIQSLELMQAIPDLSI